MSQEVDASRLPELAAIARLVLATAREAGATQAEADVSLQKGLTATVRLGEVDTVEYQRDRGLGVTVYFGRRKGSASTADLRDAAVHDTVAGVGEGGAVTGGAASIDEMVIAGGVPPPGLRLIVWTYPPATVAMPLSGKGTAPPFGIWKANSSPEARMPPLVAIAPRMPSTYSAAFVSPAQRCDTENAGVWPVGLSPS